MNWLGRKMRPATSGGKAQAKVDGIVRRGLAETTDAGNSPAPNATQPRLDIDAEVDTGFNPYDTMGPETLGRFWPQKKPSPSARPSAAAGDPYDSAAGQEKKRRSWDDAIIDTVEKRR